MSTNTENTGISRYAVSFGLSLAVVSVVNGILVVAKESSPAVMKGMQNILGHHWVTHSAMILGLFAILGWLFARRGIKVSVNRLIGVLASGVAIGALIILVFYLFGD